MDKIHTGLDVVGMIPAVGNVADLANAGLYAIEGDAVNAGISLAGCIPGAGQAATGARLATKAGKEVVEAAAKKALAKEAKEKLAKEALEKAAKEKTEKELKEKAAKEAAEKDIGTKVSEAPPKKSPDSTSGNKKKNDGNRDRNGGDGDPSNGDKPKTDFAVTEEGVAIPQDPDVLKDGLSKLDDVSTSPGKSRKFVGADDNGPMRVRIEKGHPPDPNFTGAKDPLHTVDHMHIDRRKNGATGPWQSQDKIQYDWPFE